MRRREYKKWFDDIEERMERAERLIRFLSEERSMMMREIGALDIAVINLQDEGTRHRSD